MKRVSTILVLIFVTTASIMASNTKTPIPKWRGKIPGTAWLGPDKLWRCREGLVFHLLDEKGTGFTMDVSLRDMNIYQQGLRPCLLWMTGPNGKTVAKEMVEDDGIVSGDFDYCDGVADVWQDIRYHEWHRVNSPGGYPPGKKRSPYLKSPEKLKERVIQLRIPPAGKGLYRLVVVAGWDYWLSITPDRPLAMGIHPGPGPLYIPGDRFEKAFFYAPKNVKDIILAIHEEIQPSSWSATIKEANGTQVGAIKPEGIYNFEILRNAQKGSIYELSIKGDEPGAYLHMGGVPMVLCPDAETAEKIHGGVEVDPQGRTLFHQYQKTLLEWAKALEKEDLTIDVTLKKPSLKLPIARGGVTLDVIKKIIQSQNLDPESKTFGLFVDVEKATGSEDFNFFNQPADLLAKVAGLDHPDNPYYGNPALVRRILLNRIMKYLVEQTPYFWYGLGHEGPKEYPKDPQSIWQLVLRSNWYPMHDAMHIKTLKPIRLAVDYAIPPEILDAWKTGFNNWVTTRTNLQQGECSNQWAVGIREMKNIWQATHDYEVENIIKKQIKRFTTPGSLGRVSPDLTPYSKKSAVGSPYAADSGVIGGGIAADGLGHDGEYCLETTSHMDDVWQSFKSQAIVDWLNQYYVLKTHLTLPKTGDIPKSSYSGTCSPSDSNFRTRYYTHKSPLCDELRSKIKYGDLWNKRKNENITWPCMEKGEFVRNIDNRFYFIKTPSYYSIVYGGPTSMDYQNWSASEIDGKTLRIKGYGGMHYGGLQRKATKPGGLSAVWVPNCGPTLLSANHNVNFSNVVWGRTLKPICEEWEKNQVDPYVICSAFSHPEFEFDEAKHCFTKVEKMRDVPLEITRKVVFNDDSIDVDLEIEATADTTLKELYECVPYFAENREITLFGPDLKRKATFEIPKYILASTKKTLLDTPDSGENPALPKVSFRAFDVAAKDGAGAAVVFDKEATFTQTQPIKYREIASETAAFNLPLPTKWKKGDKHRVNYKIVPHQKPLTTLR